MFSRDELSALARVAARHDLLVITDEIYEYIRYDGRPHVSPASIPGLSARTVTIMGLSKTFSITGWRLGYTFAPAEMTRAISLVNDLYFVCAPTPLQLGAAAGFAAPASYFQELQSGYQRKRDVICAALRRGGLPPIVPQGAYYVLADCSRLGFATSREAAMHLLETTRVASVAGSAFYRGAEGEKLLRFCFAKDDAVLEEACGRLAALR
jgi:aminotransferase